MSPNRSSFWQNPPQQPAHGPTAVHDGGQGLIGTVGRHVQVPPMQNGVAPLHDETQTPPGALQVRHCVASHGAARQALPQTRSFGQHSVPRRQVWPAGQAD